jgi:hypothetical protein
VEGKIMAKKPSKYTEGDRNAARYGMPGTQPQKPAKKYIVRSADGKREIASTSMNWRGVAGGTPTSDARELDKRAKSAKKSGATASAAAAEARAKNVRGSAAMTKKAKEAILMAKRKANADKAQKAIEYRTTARRPK